MASTERPDAAESSERGRARALAEEAMRAQAAGRDVEADRLFVQAQQIDPDAVAAVLAEHDAALAPDARDRPTADHDAERLARPAGDAASYPGSTGPSDGRQEQP